MIHLFSDWSDIDSEIDRVASMPTPTGKMALEGVLKEAYRSTQASVHLDTTSLKLSGKASSDTDEGKWTGELEYGGPSTGINNPVDYAIYEKARGEDHDFMASTDMLGPAWVHAVLMGLKK